VDPSGNTVTGWPKARRPAHADRPLPPPGRVAAVCFAVLVVVGAVLAGSGWLASGSSRSTPTSASLITVTPAVDTTVTTR